MRTAFWKMAFLAIAAMCMGQTSTQADPEWQVIAREVQQFREHPPMTPEEKAKADQLQTKVALMLIEAEKANFDIKGDVADEDGKPLEKVTMTIDRYRAPRAGAAVPQPAREAERVETLVDGPFEASGKGWWAMEIKFSKEGYYPRTFSFDADMRPEAVTDLLASGVASLSTVVKNGLHIELLKQSPKSPTLKNSGATLTYNADGSGQYAIFKLDDENRISWKDFKSLDEIKTLPENSFFMQFALDFDKKAFLFDDHIPYPLKVAQKISLKLDAKEGGLIMVEPRHHVMEMLRDAPEKGYQNEITFDPKMMVESRLISNDGNAPGALFYFKTADGKYGKGSIQGGIDPQKNKARFHLGVYIQTDGTRNVRSG